MGKLLNIIGQQTPVSYASILEQFEPVRPCKVSTELQRLRMRELVEYASGRYYITQLGREELSNEQL